MDVIDRDPSLFLVPAPVLEVLQDDEVQRTDIHLVTHFAEDRMVVGDHLDVTFIDQFAPVHVLVHPFDVVL